VQALEVHEMSAPTTKSRNTFNVCTAWVQIPETTQVRWFCTITNRAGRIWNHNVLFPTKREAVALACVVTKGLHAGVKLNPVSWAEADRPKSEAY
jgi:hypothetical protein